MQKDLITANANISSSPKQIISEKARENSKISHQQPDSRSIPILHLPKALGQLQIALGDDHHAADVLKSLESQWEQVEKQKMRYQSQMNRLMGKTEIIKETLRKMNPYSKKAPKSEMIAVLEDLKGKLESCTQKDKDYYEISSTVKWLSEDLDALENSRKCEDLKLDLEAKLNQLNSEEEKLRTRISQFVTELYSNKKTPAQDLTKLQPPLSFSKPQPNAAKPSIWKKGVRKLFEAKNKLSKWNSENSKITTTFGKKRHAYISRGKTIYYASNINEDWDGLEHMLADAKKDKADIIILTNILQNPLSVSEQSAYKHAFKYVEEAFHEDHAFSDIQQFIESFRNDPSDDILAVSAKKIISQIEKGLETYKRKIRTLKKILRKFHQHIVIVPGPFENSDVIKDIDADVASLYLNMRKVKIKGINILGIGGLETFDESGPLYFQNKDYYEGTEQANEELNALLTENVDIFVSFTPIRYFTDNDFEEQNVRSYVSDHLPGKLILTSQHGASSQEKPIKTATNARLIKGGVFGVPGGNKNSENLYWKLSF